MTTHFIRPASDWITDLPLTNVRNGKGQLYIAPAHPGIAAMIDIVVHYPGADWKDIGWQDFNLDGKVSVEDTATLIRQAHRMYLMGTRGYSLGYGYYIGVLGDIWEVRGLKYKNAANLGHSSKGKLGWNNYSVSIHIVVDIVNGEGRPANALQVAAANWLIDYLNAKKKGLLREYVHGDGDLTSCAGKGVTTQVHSGVIHRGQSELTRPVIPPIEKPVDPPPVVVVEPPKGKRMSAISILELSDSDAVFVGMGALNPDGSVGLLDVVWIDGSDAEALLLLQAHRDNPNTVYPRPLMNEPRSATNRYGSWICHGLITNQVPTNDPKRKWVDGDFGKVR